MSTGTPAAAGRLHLNGLDSIRFLCALLVVLSHTGLPAPAGDGPFVRTVRTLFALSLNGQGAVMVFFVISGLCIHLPNVGARAVNWRAFFARRCLRLGLPLAGAWLVGSVADDDLLGSGVRAVIWSLIAEFIYYLAYPALLWAGKRWGWGKVLLGAVPAALCSLALSPQVLQPWLLPTWQIALGFLPAWLLGCLLAEQVAGNALPRHSQGRCWLMRLLIWLAVMASFASIFHLPAAVPPIRFSFSLLALAGVAWLWLRQELAAGQLHPPPRWLEWCGLWSYSLYLTHLDWLHLWDKARGHLGLGVPATWLETLARTAFVCGLAIVFYLAIEAPSHRLARNAAHRLSPKDRP